MALLLLFIDGLGIGPREGNPLRAAGARVLGFDAESVGDYAWRGGSLRAIDANLGVDGLPQSATGQTAIFTGLNAPAAIGGHLSGTPNAALREMLRTDSIFISLRRAGCSVTFANAFTPAYFLFPLKRISASSLHMLGAGLPPRWIWQIPQREAIFQDFTNRSLIEAGFDLPEHTTADAAACLVNLLDRHDFVLYEYFLTDAAAHARIRPEPVEIIGQLDAMLDALMEQADLARHTIALCSDHGNIEEGSTRVHTRYPVPFISWGHRAGELSERIDSIADIKGAICRWFGLAS
jgi:hypothetical protein